jgi:hypothetical protein
VTRLALNLNVLPENQREVWERLGATPGNFVLYEGTALALRLGHRESIDFDFFSRPSFQPSMLMRSIPYLENQTVTQQSESTLSKADLMAAVKSVSLQNLPTVSASQSIGEGIRWQSP